MTGIISLFARLTAAASPVHAARRVDDGARSVEFAALVQEHGPALEAAALRLCRSRPDARDLVQDAFERALRGLRTYDRKRPARTWLLTIVKNLFIDRVRKASREGVRTELHESHAVTMAGPDGAQDPRPAWARITAYEFHAAIAKLPEEFRGVYKLSAEGKSYAEIASILGIPKNTVGTRLMRARSKLRRILEPEAPDEGEP